MSLSDLSEALKRGAPAAAAAVATAAAGPLGLVAPGGAGGAGGGAGAAGPVAAAGVAATEAQNEEIQARKQNSALKGTGPADLTVLRYGDFASTTIPGERVPQDANFLMDRRLFDRNFSSDAPILDSQFFFHLPKKEKKEIVRF
jgi:hypothetical protein